MCFLLLIAHVRTHVCCMLSSWDPNSGEGTSPSTSVCHGEMANNDYGGYFNPRAPHFSQNWESENMARWGDVTINHKSHRNDSWRWGKNRPRNLTGAHSSWRFTRSSDAGSFHGAGLQGLIIFYRICVGKTFQKTSIMMEKGGGDLHHFLGCKRTSIREKPYEAMHRLLPFFLPMIFTHQGFCRTQLRLQCAWQSNVLGSGWKHCYKHKHMETKARWVVKCLTASTTPTPSRLCKLKMAPLTRMLQNDSDFSREQTRTDVSFCGFLGILMSQWVKSAWWFQLRVGSWKNPGLEKLHYDKQICRSLAVDHGVWCLKDFTGRLKSLRNNLGSYWVNLL